MIFESHIKVYSTIYLYGFENFISQLNVLHYILNIGNILNSLKHCVQIKRKILQLRVCVCY